MSVGEEGEEKGGGQKARETRSRNVQGCSGVRTRGAAVPGSLGHEGDRNLEMAVWGRKERGAERKRHACVRKWGNMEASLEHEEHL